MNILTCAIIDDEPLARQLLESYVARTPFLELKGQYCCASEAMRSLIEQPVDLLFLDIQMPDMDGMTFSRMVPAETRIIFTTAFSEYAVEGFRVNALDYLKKPINYTEFLESANKAFVYFQNRKTDKAATLQIPVMQKDEFIFVKSDYKLVQVPLDRLLYIEGLKDYLKIYVEGSHPILTLMSMKTMEERLPSPRFIRIHRSYIVQSSKITSVNKSALVIGDKNLPISEGYKEPILEFINSHLI